MKLKILFSVLALSFLFLMSCSEDDKTNDPTDNLLPMKVGAYWIMDYWTVDTTGRRVEDEHALDSIVVSAQQQMMGKTAYGFTRYRTPDGEETMEMPEQYFAKESGRIYLNSQSFFSNINLDRLPVELPIELPEEWFLILDPNKDEWVIYADTISEVPLDIPDFGEATYNGILRIRGEKAGTVQLETLGESYTAYKFTVYTELIDSYIERQNFQINFPLESRTHFWFVNDIGLVQERNDVFELELPFLGAYKFEGYETVLIRYNAVE